MDDLVAVQYGWLIPLAPLLAALLAGLMYSKSLRPYAHLPVWAGIGVSAVLSLMLLFGALTEWRATDTLEASQTVFTWIDAGVHDVGDKTSRFVAQFGFYFDPLTAVMLCVVCGVGFLIAVFAAGYMKGEDGYYRFFAYVGLFISAMTILVMGDNLIMLYLGWEGVGLCSYLLIGYYYDTPEARDASKKAFIVNRIGDLGFALGIMLAFLAFGTVSFFGDSESAGLLQWWVDGGSAWTSNNGERPPLSGFQEMALYAIPFLLLLGAIGKSAQFPLYVWLPDAMAGPTPVSALIHAATMVTAGVYMIVRCGAMFYGNVDVLVVIGVIAAFGAVFTATMALRQFDLKKVFAYSTVSQLGFMFVGAAALAPVAAIFHLVTHAFFKAVLFLSSGVVMHACHGELDMRKMSGLKNYLPLTRWIMFFSCLALAGLPPFAGFFSKDMILVNAWYHNLILGIVMLIAAFMTAYYTFRLYFRVFTGPEVIPQPSHDDHGHGHDHHGPREPIIMMAPLLVLTVGAIFGGLLSIDVGNDGKTLGSFLGQSKSLVYGHAAAVDKFHDKAKGESFGLKDIDKMVAKGQANADVMLASQAHGDHAHTDGTAKTDADTTHKAGHDDHGHDDHGHDAKHALHLYMMIGSGALALFGIILAYVMHGLSRETLEAITRKTPGLNALLENKYYIDEIYNAAIVQPIRWIGNVFFFIDRYVVSAAVFIVTAIPQAGGYALKLTLQRGYVQGYALSMVLGVVIILLIVFL